MATGGIREILGARVSSRRQLGGAALALALLTAVTAVLAPQRSELSLATEALIYQLIVVVVALVGGLWPAIVTAVVAAAVLDLFYIEPLNLISVQEPVHVLALVVFLVVAILVSITVGRAARTKPLEEADRMRTALLAAVGHDLRTPLSAATAAVSSLSSTEVQWTPTQRADLLDTAEVSLARLATLVDDLLDVSRLRAGVLAVSLEPTDLVEIALRVADSEGRQVAIAAEPDLPDASADPVLVERILENLVANALEHGASATHPTIEIAAGTGLVTVRVVDHGRGVPHEKRGTIFAPFQRLGDVTPSTGTGLGLALSSGFAEAMGGTLVPSETPGGGLTMALNLRTTS